ncbi:ribosome silencing factor [Thalassoglobus sp. JC818]|uniref:ribosome silencing factor n=1 Tax=Thalassoglobus sp. JC818 TaxID=3232136 RepID=UPI003459A3F9
MVDTTGTRVSKSGGNVTGIRTESAIQTALENARRVAQVCDEFRGQDTIVLDVTHITPLFDYFVITTGRSRRQLHAIADQSDDVMDQQGTKRRSTTGYETEWICQDYGDVVLHVFSPAAREQYSLEDLWADAIQVEWSNGHVSESENGEE